MRIHYKKTYVRAFKKLSKKLQIKVLQTIDLFSDEPYNRTLNRHKLSGKLKGFESINVTGDIRIIFYSKKNDTIIEVIDLGTHSKLYG